MLKSTSPGGRARLFWQVSALALIAVGAGGRKAEAATATDGTITLDLQGQWAFASDGVNDGPASQDSNFRDAISPVGGYNLSGEITYQPASSPWSFGVGVRYGRVSGHHAKNHAFATTAVQHTPGGYGLTHYTAQNLAISESAQEHYTIDFEVGRDFGVGMFGPGTSTLGAGVRYAHFNSTVTGSFRTNTKYTVRSPGGSIYPGYTHSKFKAGRFTQRRATDAVGPRLFVKTVSPITPNSAFSIGAGAGVAFLFGRQTVHSTLHMTSGTYANPSKLTRTNSRGTPNVDGYLQLNWSPAHSGFSVGVGYKVDAYFTVMDGGFGGKKEIDNLEHGPYLDISVKFP